MLSKAKKNAKAVGVIVGESIIGNKAMRNFQAGNWRQGLKYASEMIAIQVGIQLAVVALDSVTFGAGGTALEAAAEGSLQASRAMGTAATDAADIAATRSASSAASDAADIAATRSASSAATESIGVARATSSAAETGAAKSVSGVGMKAVEFADESVAGGGGGKESSAVVESKDLFGSNATKMRAEQVLEDLNKNVKVDHPYLKRFKDMLSTNKGGIARNEISYRANFDRFLEKNPDLAKKYGIKNAEEGLAFLKKIETKNAEAAETIFKEFMGSQRGVTSGGFVDELPALKYLVDNPQLLSETDKGFLQGFLDSDTFVGRQAKYFIKSADKDPEYSQYVLKKGIERIRIRVKSESGISTTLARISLK